MDAGLLDQIGVSFNPANLLAINIMIGLMMLGVALDLRPGDFRRILSAPRGFAAGVAAQLLLLPALTYLLTRVLNPPPQVSLAMILISACPGSNLSNILSYLAGGNSALSIAMTAFCTISAIWLTPLNLSLWGGLGSETALILRPIGLDPSKTFLSLFMIVGLPLTLGLVLSHLFPSLADTVRRPFRLFSTAVFFALAGILLSSMGEVPLTAVGPVLFFVVVANALAFGLGYGSGMLLRLEPADQKAVCVEVGIHNPALALLLVFNFFDGAGGMALYSVLWGVWQILLGLLLSALFRRRVRHAALSSTLTNEAESPGARE